MSKKSKKVLIIVFAILVLLLTGIWVVGMLAERAVFNFFNEIKIPSCDGKTINQIRLGEFNVSDGAFVEFSTTGKILYILPQKINPVTVSDFAHYVEVTVGMAKEQGAYNLKDSANTKLTAIKNRYNSLELPAGRYWLAVSRYAEITLASCESDSLSDFKIIGKTK